MEDGIMRCALFAGMCAEEIEALLGQMACTRRQYEKGEVLLHAGYENRSIGVVLHGEIAGGRRHAVSHRAHGARRCVWRCAGWFARHKKPGDRGGRQPGGGALAAVFCAGGVRAGKAFAELHRPYL